MTIERHVTVERVRLKFAASHMATLVDQLEPLHGHNYLVRCRVKGDLTDDRWVIDFSTLKQYARDICDELDHHFLLQRNSRLIDIEEREDSWALRFGKREYVLPKSDVVALPIENTTAELLAEYIAERIIGRLEEHGHQNITRISVDVEEMPGQAGGYARGLQRQ
ncbi:MAG: 6-carboxytetrahydropterin synthase [Chloroflexi bacterium]|nr:6-carboxytetrahydropterin synthase [Chloroflexota bacterium]